MSQQSQPQIQPQSFEDDDIYGGGAGAKAKITRKRYTREMIVMLLEIVDEVLPYGNKDWEVVAAKYNQIFSDDRDYVSVRKKYFDLVPKGVPVPLQTAENLRADLVQKRIHIRQQTGVVPPPTAPEVLIALYTNSNLPLPGFLRSYAQNNPQCVVQANSLTAPTPDNTENDVSVAVSPDGNGSVSGQPPSSSQQPASLLGKRKSNADSLLNLSTLNSVNSNPVSTTSNANTTNGNHNGALNNQGNTTNNSSVSIGVFPPANFIASTATITASMANNLANMNAQNANGNGNGNGNNALKNEDYQQYLANPQLFKPSPIGAGLSTILYKIMQLPTLRNTSPTILVPAKNVSGTVTSSTIQQTETPAMVTLASLAERRTNGVLLTEMGKLEEILLDLYSAHERLGVYMAEQMQQIASNQENMNGNKMSADMTAEETATQKDETSNGEMGASTFNLLSELRCTGPELMQLNTVYMTSYTCAHQVAQWLDVHRPQYKKLKLTPYQLQKMKRSGGNIAVGGNNALRALEKEGIANNAQGEKGEKRGDAEEVNEEEEVDEEEGNEDDNDDELKKENEDEAADDFEDLYVRKTPSVAEMDTD